MARKGLNVNHVGEFKSIFKTALDHESGGQFGTFDEITFDKKNLTLLSLWSAWWMEDPDEQNGDKTAL